MFKLLGQNLLKDLADTDQGQANNALAEAQFLEEKLDAGWAAFAENRGHDR